MSIGYSDEHRSLTTPSIVILRCLQHNLRVNGEGRVVLEPEDELDAVAGGRGGVARKVDGAALHGGHARLRN